jgi:L-fuculose-phosphate aldolase
MKSFNHLLPEKQIVMIMHRMYQHGLTSLSGGNLSIYDQNDNFWITPTAVDKGNLKTEDIVVFNKKGEFKGNFRPSSEYPFHWAIYKKRNDISAIVHAHSPALIAFSIAGKVPNSRITPVSYQNCGEIGFAEYASPGSQQLAASIAEVFAKGYNIVILENHGVVTGGLNLITAFEHMETLEYTARTLLNANSLGKVHYIESQELLDSWMNPVFSTQVDSIDVDSQKLQASKKLLVRITHRAYRQHLMFSTSGSASMRLDSDTFLVTPYGLDRQWLDEDDLVVIQDQRRTTGHQPSRLVNLHRAIYQKHRDIEAIMTSQSPYSTAFAITDANIDTRSIPESYILLRHIGRVSLADAMQNPEMVANMISPQSPAIMIENLGVLVTGPNLLQAYDRLEVTEFSARSLIEAKSLGGLKPLTDEEVKRLAFL